MTQAHSWPLQQAVVARLTAALATAAPGGGGISVFDHPPADPDRVHVRLDGFYVIAASLKAGGRASHVFRANIFDRPGRGGRGRGQRVAREILSSVVSALDGWSPIAGQPAILFERSSVELEGDDRTHRAIAEFTVNLGD